MGVWGDIYIAAVKATDRMKQTIVEKLKKRGCKLNQKEIRFVEFVTKIRTTTRPTRTEAARIIKAITGENVTARIRGNIRPPL